MKGSHRFGSCLLVLGLSLFSCSGEKGLRIIVETRGFIQEDSTQLEVDELTFEMIATTPADQRCRMERRTPWLNTSPIEFPVVLVIHSGERNWQCLGLRITGYSRNEPVIVREDFFCPDWNEITEEKIELHGPCHREAAIPAECMENQVCRTRDSSWIDDSCSEVEGNDTVYCCPSIWVGLFEERPVIDCGEF